MRRSRPIKEYEVIVKTGPSGSKEDGTFGWDSIKTLYRYTRWDADVEATEQRRINPDAVVIVRAA